jgi:hypothetical protein
MKKRNERDALNEAIQLLQDKQAEELRLLKEQFYVTYESIKPINLIKSTWREITESPEAKNNLLSNAIGLTAGYLSKKALIGFSHNPVKLIVGSILQFVVSNVAAKHADAIKSTGGSLLQRGLNYIKKVKQDQSDSEGRQD